MKKNELIIAKILQENLPNPVTGEYLASSLSVSTRTIRNYIKNLIDAGYLINSSKNGYTYVQGVSNNSPLESDELQVLSHLLSSSKVGISKVSLANGLFISERTLDRRVEKINTFLVAKKLKIINENGYIRLHGDEVSKRHLLVQLLKDESKNDIVKEFLLNNSQSENQLIDILNSTFKEYDIPVDNILIKNILIHLVILLYRTKNANYLKVKINDNLHDKLKNSNSLKIAKTISNKIKLSLKINIPEGEVDNIALLMLDNINNRDVSPAKLKDLVDSKFYFLSLIILQSVKNNYSINLLNNKGFISRFALHLQNLYERTKNKNSDLPSMNKGIKTKFPFIYDISVFISSQLEEVYNCQISEKEIDFISMHIGTMVSAQENNKRLQKLILVDKDYLNSNETIIETISSSFPDKIIIDDVYQSYDELPSDVDFYEVISTVDPPLNKNILMITPFISNQDIDSLQKRINFLKSNIEKKNSFKYIQGFLPEELVFRNINFNTRNDVIDFLSKKLYKKNLVDASFAADIKRREKLSSTSFINDVALPHTLKPMSKKTTLSLIINQSPISWGGKNVRIIFLLALSQNDNYQSILDSLILTLSKSENITNLIKSSSYDEIIAILNNNLNN